MVLSLSYFKGKGASYNFSLFMRYNGRTHLGFEVISPQKHRIVESYSQVLLDSSIV